jgi:hypothetical protein
MRDFWKSAGFNLLEADAEGKLAVTADFLRAYFTRPEIHPIDESGPNEVALFEALMADPFMKVDEAGLEAIEDPDTRENYRVVLRFRDQLAEAGTVEGAYLAIVRSDRIALPPVFIDQMVHAILRNILRSATDPIRLRAAEIFFRDQMVSTEEGRVMLADDEIVEMYSETGGLGGLGQLLVESGTPLKQVELDVLGEDNKDIYWDRSDRFDTVIDLRFTQPALDALARVIESWVVHFTGVNVRVHPMQRIDDERWTWHIGLDAEASRILNGLYEGRDMGFEDMQQIIALFRMTFEDPDVVRPSVRGRPVYLGLAMSRDRKLKMKPQNLLINLPLISGT